MIRLMILSVLISVTNLAQKPEFYRSFGDFSNASSFYITSNGFIYVSDKGNDEVLKLDTLGNVLKDIGGFGWNTSQFDEPIDIFADPLTVYVTDKNNHRIQRFDKNLNFVSALFTRENDNVDEQFGYPLGCVVSNQGDLYILDSENKRVIKFDLFGNYQMNFGGIDAGNYSLNNPKCISINSAGYIFIADGNNILTFDQFGNGINKLTLNDKIESLKILFDNLVVITTNSVLISDAANRFSDFIKIELDYCELNNEKTISGLIFNRKLYLLTPKNISIFTLLSEN